MAPTRYDAVVVGGGPGGAAAALAMAHGGRRVLLLDAARPGAFRVGEALPPAGRPLLRDLGVLDAFLADAASHLPCYANRSAWGGEGVHETDFIFDRNGHGWHLDRARFDALLRAGARLADADVRESTRLRSAERIDGHWRLSLSESAKDEGDQDRNRDVDRNEDRDGDKDRDDRIVEADWLIDATGRSAAVARRHGAERLHDDALVAFVARFRPPPGGDDRDARTLVESAPDGWWYAALVPSGERVVAYLTDRDLAGRELLTIEGFLARLAGTEHVRAAVERHGGRLIDAPRGADAGSARLDRFTGDGWLAAGDAAISFDPLSSQGILTALYTGMKAGQALDAHLSSDPGALAAYVDRLEEVHRAYAANRLTFYGYEQRWRDRPFWRRRIEGG